MQPISALFLLSFYSVFEAAVAWWKDASRGVHTEAASEICTFF
jgi:hypothetical protein